MLEIQRPVQLPSLVGQPIALMASADGAVLRSVEPAPPPRGVDIRHGRERRTAGDEPAEIAGDAQLRRRSVDPDSLAEDGQVGRFRLRVGRLAFMTQQLYQEEMPRGIHLEPWTVGIGAYHRAGAEPLAESAAPAVVSFSV